MRCAGGRCLEFMQRESESAPDLCVWIWRRSRDVQKLICTPCMTHDKHLNAKSSDKPAEQPDFFYGDLCPKVGSHADGSATRIYIRSAEFCNSQ